MLCCSKLAHINGILNFHQACLSILRIASLFASFRSLRFVSSLYYINLAEFVGAFVRNKPSNLARFVIRPKNLVLTEKSLHYDQQRAPFQSSLYLNSFLSNQIWDAKRSKNSMWIRHKVFHRTEEASWKIFSLTRYVVNTFRFCFNVV